MKSAGTTFLILIVIVGLVLGIILVSSPNKTVAPSQNGQTTNQTSPNPNIVGQFEGFNEYSYDVQKQDAKPVVYLFSTTTCPHCVWIKDTFDKWAKDNSDKIVAYHFELDTGDNTLTDQKETAVPADAEAIYNKFNSAGTVPTFIFGGKFARIGNGFESEQDLTKEAATYNDVLNKLLGK